jgi:hypothetical protein
LEACHYSVYSSNHKYLRRYLLHASISKKEFYYNLKRGHLY